MVDRIESLTGTIYDTVHVTEEGLITACAGIVTPGECVPTRPESHEKMLSD